MGSWLFVVFMFVLSASYGIESTAVQTRNRITIVETRGITDGDKEVSICHEQRDSKHKLSCKSTDPISIKEVRQFVISDVILSKSSCCGTEGNMYRCSSNLNITSDVQKKCDESKFTDGICTVKVPDVLGKTKKCSYTVISYSCNDPERPDAHIGVRVISTTISKDGGLPKCSSEQVCEQQKGTVCGNKTVKPNTTENDETVKPKADPNTTKNDKTDKETVDPNATENDKTGKPTGDANTTENDDIGRIVPVVVVVVAVLILVVILLVCCVCRKRRRKSNETSRFPTVQESHDLVYNGGTRGVNNADIAFEPETVIISDYSDISVTYSSVNKIRNTTNTSSNAANGCILDSASPGRVKTLDIGIQNQDPENTEKCHQFSKPVNNPDEASDGGLYDHMDRYTDGGQNHNITIGTAPGVKSQPSKGYMYDHIPLRVSEFFDDIYDKPKTQTAPESVSSFRTRDYSHSSPNGEHISMPESVPNIGTAGDIDSSTSSDRDGNSDHHELTFPCDNSAKLEKDANSNGNECKPNSPWGDGSDNTYDRLECKHVNKPQLNTRVVNNTPAVPPKPMNRCNDYSLEDLSRHDVFSDQSPSHVRCTGYQYPHTS